MVKRRAIDDKTVNWGRAAAIFGNPKPPHTVWEQQFDYADGDLQRMARTPYKKFDFSDLWYYHHDLAYVELQPELFAYLFPVCLMDWHDTLMKSKECSHGDSEFHYGVHQGQVFEKMVTEQQRKEITEFFRDSFLCRLDVERGFIGKGKKRPAYGWLGRFNSLGLIIPKIDVIWNAWWSLETPGRAVAALQYCSGLMYFEYENPIFDRKRRGGPYLWANDSHIYDAGWMDANIHFLRQTLTVDFVKEKVEQAFIRLREEPEYEIAQHIKNDLEECEDLVTERVHELPSLLQDPNANGWTV